MPRKRGPARTANAIKRKHRFRKKHTHHVTPVRMKELLEEAKALLEEWLVNYDAVEVQVLADLVSKLVVDLQEIEDKLDHADWGLAALKALIDDVEAKLDHAGHGLAALKALIDAVEAKLDHGTHGLAALKALMDALEAKLDDGTTGLAALKALIDAIEAKLDHGTWGLAALKALLDALELKLDDLAPGLAALAALIDAVEAKLDHGTWGLAALKALIDAVEAKLDDGTTGLAALKALIDAVEAKLDHGTYGLAALKALIDAIEAKLDHGTWGLEALKDLIDGLTHPFYADIKVYPWAGTVVLDADPAYTYTAEVSQAAAAYVKVGHFDFNEEAGDIKSIFVNLVWAQKITGSGSGKVKWQIASGSDASPGAYVDITDEVTETSSSYEEHGRSGIVHKITNLTTTVPFTIRCLVANIDATSAEAKIKSNSYIRVAYKRS